MIFGRGHGRSFMIGKKLKPEKYYKVNVNISLSWIWIIKRKSQKPYRHIG